MCRISNAEMCSAVTRRVTFINNNDSAYAVFLNDLYVVYSYGSHFPMYVYDGISCEWFGNSDKYSVTTSRHQTAARPDVDHINWLDTHGLQALINEGGYVGYCAERCTGWEELAL